MSAERALVVFATHPIQYHAPVFRSIQMSFGVPVTVIYGSDFSIAGGADAEFGTAFSWDTDLLSGYTPVFLARGGNATSNVERILPRGLDNVMQSIAVGAVLLTGYRFKFHRAAFQYARRAGYPLLFRGESTDHAESRGRLKRLIRDQALRWYYSHFRKLLYIGQQSFQHFCRLGCRLRSLEFSPYCVDARHFSCDEDVRNGLRSDARLELAAGDSETVLLFSGKLSHRKGPDLLLASVASLPTEIRRNIIVVFLGSGELEASLKEQSRAAGLNGRFLGFRNQTQLSRYYHAADLLVLPSLHSETWGLVVNEALHHGLPCIVSSAVGSAPDLISPGLTGEVCDAESRSSLTCALVRGMSLVGRAGIRDACRAKVSGYTTDKAAEGIARAYCDVVNTGTCTTRVGG